MRGPKTACTFIPILFKLTVERKLLTGKGFKMFQIPFKVERIKKGKTFVFPFKIYNGSIAIYQEQNVSKTF